MSPSSAPWRPTVLCVVDRPNWAHDRKTDALAGALGGTYEIVKRYQAEVSADDLRRADCVLLYYWLQAERLKPLREVLWSLRDRLVIGICGHNELAGAWRAPGLATLEELARTVFVNNRRLLEEFGPLLTRPVVYTPNGVDTELFRPAAAPGPPAPKGSLRVGWAGSLTNHGPEHRGVHEFIAPAVAAVEGAELRLAIREEKWRSHAEMLDFYHSLDVYVCASLSEGSPNPCLEAAACGLPVVTTRVGNMPELIRHGENGFFVERDAADIAEKLRWLRDDPGLRVRLGRAARRDVELWDWRHLAVHYDAMLRAVVRQEKESPGAPAPGAGSGAQIAVLGMHRSGTSAVTRLLHGMGCYGGPEDRFPIPDEANPKGYWENSDVVILDDALLAALGGQWCDVAGLDLSHLSKADRETFRDRARELVRRFDPWAPWVFKDPRLCLLFPFWREVLERPVCVLVWRDPLPVARSLEKRHGLPLLLGIALWEHYNREALAATLDLPRVLVSYRDLVDDPVGTVRRLHAELVRLSPVGGDRLTLPPDEEILAFIAPSLERQGPDPELEQEYLNTPQRRLLQSLASGEALGLDPVPPLSQGAREVLATHSERQAEERARLTEIEELQGRITTLRDKAMRWTQQLDDVISALLVSHSWRVGRALTSPLRRLLGRTSELTAGDRRDRILDEQKRALDSKSFEPG